MLRNVEQDTGTKELVIFANPIAGRGRAVAIAQRLWGQLRQEGYGMRAVLQPADTLGREHLAEAPPWCVIVIGGDGTLRAVTEYLLAGAWGRAVPPILVVPVGTANLMGRHLGISWDEENLDKQVAAALGRGQVIHVDAARANGGLMLLVAGVGIDGHIVHELGRVRRGPIRGLSYVMPAVMALREYEYPPLRVSVDGVEVFGEGEAMAFVGNIAEYGTGFAILPHARADDGMLDVCVIPCRSRGQLVELFLQAAMGEHLEAEGVVYVKGKSVRIESPREVPVQVDGEAAGFTPVAIDLLPMRIPFIVP
jgi:YegS/Rv2252/BmrU family lipid kinase